MLGSSSPPDAKMLAAANRVMRFEVMVFFENHWVIESIMEHEQAAIGLARCVRSNHSCIVGRSAARSSSLLMKSERLIPSRAARDFRVPCTCSGTSLTWIILDMSSAYKHVWHMSIWPLPHAPTAPPGGITAS